MNKKVLIAAGLLLLLLLGFWYFRKNKKEDVTPLSQAPEATQNTTSPSSLKDLLTKGTSQSCTFDNTGTTGKVYISGGKVRGDFDTSTEKTTTKAHMIVMDNTSYIWTEGQTTGFKMAYDPTASPPASGTKTQTAGTAGLDANTDMNYNCTPWTPDLTLFNLPAGVTFTSFAVPSTQVVPQQQGSGITDPAASQCAYCDTLTPNDKIQCRAALKCN